jgi:hypothetical protein
MNRNIYIVLVIYCVLLSACSKFETALDESSVLDDTADSCKFDDGLVIKDGRSITAYQSGTVAYGQSCVSEIRQCNKGALSGSYSSTTCIVQPAAVCNFNGLTVLHLGNVTAYQASTVPFGQTCISQSRTCNNGILSGSYINSSCSVLPQTTTPSQPIPQIGSDFDTLSKASNVVIAFRGNEAGFFNNDPRLYSLPYGSMQGSLTRPVFDATQNGIRFDLPPVPQGTSAANIAGSFYFNFGKHFAGNQKFRVRWQQMFNQPMVKTKLLNYTAIKQAIIGSGDGAGIPPQSSCTAPDIVVTSYQNFRFSHLYHSCGRYWGLYGSPTYNYQSMQPPVDGKYCNYTTTTEQARAGDTVTPPAACVGWPVMKWQDYALEVENGEIVPEFGQYKYSVVRLYIGTNADGSLHLAHEWDSRKERDAAWKGLGLFVGNATTGERYFGKFVGNTLHDWIPGWPH